MSGSWFVVGIGHADSSAVGHYRLLAEEHACLIQYGSSYQEYMDRVPRYFLFF